MANCIRLVGLAWLLLGACASRPDIRKRRGVVFAERDNASGEVGVMDGAASATASAKDTLGNMVHVHLDSHLAGETLAVLFNLILSFGCSTCILLATWPFGGLMCSWFWTKYKYTWPTHVIMTWFDVGCIGLFCTNLYAILIYPEMSRQLSAAGAPEGLPFSVWRGNFTVNCVMQGLWGLHNLHQWIIIMRGADKGTETEWRRPYPMFLWSLLGACGTGFVRNLIIILTGQVNDTVTWVTGTYEVICLLLLLADLGYFLMFEHHCEMNKSEDYGMELVPTGGRASRT